MKKALKPISNKCVSIIAAFLLVLQLSACAGRELVSLPVADDYDVVAGATPSGELRVGLVPGLYGDLFTQTIQPALEEMGYSIEIIQYDSYSLPNIALSRNQIDLNMFQHYKSLNSYKFDNDAALSAIVEVPTAPMGIFSSVYDSIQDIEYGATVSMPSGSADLARALVVLENAGLISLAALQNKERATEGDIVSNPLGLVLFPLPSESTMQSLSICDLSVLDIGHNPSGNLELSDALYREAMNEDYLVVVAVRTQDLHAQFINDIISIVHSDEYKAVISAPDGAFADFQWPPSFYE